MTRGDSLWTTTDVDENRVTSRDVQPSVLANLESSFNQAQKTRRPQAAPPPARQFVRARRLPSTKQKTTVPPMMSVLEAAMEASTESSDESSIQPATKRPVNKQQVQKRNGPVHGLMNMFDDPVDTSDDVRAAPPSDDGSREAPSQQVLDDRAARLARRNRLRDTDDCPVQAKTRPQSQEPEDVTSPGTVGGPVMDFDDQEVTPPLPSEPNTASPIAPEEAAAPAVNPGKTSDPETAPGLASTQNLPTAPLDDQLQENPLPEPEQNVRPMVQPDVREDDRQPKPASPERPIASPSQSMLERAVQEGVNRAKFSDFRFKASKRMPTMDDGPASPDLKFEVKRSVHRKTPVKLTEVTLADESPCLSAMTMPTPLRNIPDEDMELDSPASLAVLALSDDETDVGLKQQSNSKQQPLVAFQERRESQSTGQVDDPTDNLQSEEEEQSLPQQTRAVVTEQEADSDSLPPQHPPEEEDERKPAPRTAAAKPKRGRRPTKAKPTESNENVPNDQPRRSTRQRAVPTRFTPNEKGNQQANAPSAYSDDEEEDSDRSSSSSEPDAPAEQTTPHKQNRKGKNATRKNGVDNTISVEAKLSRLSIAGNQLTRRPVRARVQPNRFVPNADSKRQGGTADIDDASSCASEDKAGAASADDESGSPNSDAPVDEDGWTTQQLDALKDAHASVDPRSSWFWHHVAQRVVGRSWQECRDKWLSLVATPKQRGRPVAATKAAGYRDASDGDSHRDNIFESSPLVGMFTKMANHSLDDSREEESPIHEPSARPTQDVFADSDDDEDDNATLKLQPRPGYKTYLQRMGRQMRQENGRKKKAAAIKGPKVRARGLTDRVVEGDVEVTARLSPGATFTFQHVDADLDLMDEDIGSDDDSGQWQ